LYDVEAAKQRTLARLADGQGDVSAIPLPSEVKVTRATIQESSEDEDVPRPTGAQMPRAF
jgi:hypothetical protein